LASYAWLDTKHYLQFFPSFLRSRVFVSQHPHATSFFSASYLN